MVGWWVMGSRGDLLRGRTRRRGTKPSAPLAQLEAGQKVKGVEAEADQNVGGTAAGAKSAEPRARARHGVVQLPAMPL